MLLAEGGELSPSAPEELEALIRGEVAKWAKVIEAAGIRAGWIRAL